MTPFISPDEIEVLIPAGGLGTRLRTVVPNSPKPMALIQKKPFLEWLLEFLKIQGFKNITILTGYKSEIIKNYFGDGSNFGVRIKYSHEDSPLGTGGAVALAMKSSQKKHFLVLNGDTLFCIDLKKFIQNVKAPITIALNYVSDISRYGCVHLSTEGIIKQFNEKKSIQSAGLINAGVYYLNAALISEFYKPIFSLEKDIFEPLAARNMIVGITCEGDFIDIGTPETYEEAQTKIPAWIDLLQKRSEQ